jgi:hypothetical protein
MKDPGGKINLNTASRRRPSDQGNEPALRRSASSASESGAVGSRTYLRWTRWSLPHRRSTISRSRGQSHNRITRPSRAKVVEEVRASNDDRGQELLDEAFANLEQEVPDRVTTFIHWIRSPRSRWIRLPLGIVCIVASFFWFLPVIGIEFFPIGLLLIAQDVPFLRRPAAKLLLWLEREWRGLRRRFKRRS